MQLLVRKLAVVSLLTTAFSVSAQVKVVESVSVGDQQRLAERQQQAEEQQRANAQLFYQLQTLQEEVLRLQGVLEEQNYELQQLKQQQRDDYMNLDRRLGEIGQSPAAASHSASAPQAGSEDYAKAYQAAYDLIPQRKFADARTAFEAFVAKYSDTPYTGNAYYWLGELYIIEADNSKAKDAFRTILTRFPGHNKYPEALYKTATINYEQGDKTTARQQLDTLIKQYGDIQSSADVIGKARTFLQKNYP